MKLGTDFYQIISLDRTESGFTCRAELSANHPVYAGHFPEQAVVPGVCTLAVIRECTGKAIGRDVVFETIKECKFISALLPYDRLTLKLDFTLLNDTQLNGMVSCCNDNRTVLKLKATIK